MTLQEDTELICSIKEYTTLQLIQHSNLHKGSMLLFEKKQGSSLRMCVNYQQVNEMLMKDVYPLPRIDT
jgi:hypothetical protein